jgi:hypothetical protein
MACITFIAPTTMATTQLARAIQYEEASVWQESTPERTPLRMSWVVASDRDGKRKLQMQWEPSE